MHNIASTGTREKPPKGGKVAAPLDTLAQLDQKPPGHPQTLQKRARAKFLSLPLSTALADLKSPLEKSYRNTIYCAAVISQDAGKLTSKYCGNRWCMVCSRIRTARAINAYVPILETWQAPHMVTLTVRNVGAAELADTIAEMLQAFESYRRSTKRTAGLPLLAVRKLECTYNVDRQDYHPHFHVIINGREQAELLRASWLRYFPDRTKAEGQDVREADREKSLVELFKYFTKLTTKSHNDKGRRIMPVHALDVIFRAMKGRRVWQPLGFKLPKAIEEEIEGEGLEVDASEAVKRIEELVFWQWHQDVSDWVDPESGETLSGYDASERFREFVDSASASIPSQPSDSLSDKRGDTTLQRERGLDYSPPNGHPNSPPIEKARFHAVSRVLACELIE